MRAVRLLVRGRVQGVGFRWFAREQARRCDLAGWVRNAPDGTVEIVAAGDPAYIDRFVDAVRRGPPGARVDAVECVPVGADTVSGRSFSILH